MITRKKNVNKRPRKLSRTPPLEVRRRLQREVRYGCPVPGCGSPFLEWHHFDPPFAQERHHRPEGMIALCRDHHPAADAGAFTTEQFREMKRAGQTQDVLGKFNWLRRDLLAIAGGNFFYETPILLQIRNEPVIWFTRDEANQLLLNIKMITTSDEPRLRIEDHVFLVVGNPIVFECPPSGRKLRAEYSNGDMIAVEFYELETAADLEARFPQSFNRIWQMGWPITAVELHYAIGGTAIRFGPRESTIGGATFIGNFMSRGKIAILLN